jgi:hypothetical protein
MTTPPQSFAPLPQHLRHHHNYRHAERAQITPEPMDASMVTINSASNVKGCGGVIQSHNLVPRSKAQRSPIQKKRRVLNARRMSCVFPTMHRFSIVTSRSTPKKGKKLQKRVRPSSAGGGIGQTEGQRCASAFASHTTV